MKYIIDIEDEPFTRKSDGEKLYLSQYTPVIFAARELDFLTPYDESAAEQRGREEAWSFEQKIMAPASFRTSEEYKRELTKAITAGIIATNTKDVYSCGMRNGMRWCKSLIDDKRPKYEESNQYVPKTFIAIDTKADKEADPYEIALHEYWAKKLMYAHDMDGFAIMQDGSLILCDECGNFVYCPKGRFEVRWE